VVRGATLRELKSALDARSAGGVEWTGRTQTAINANVPTDAKGCRLYDASIKLTLTVILPALAPETRLSAGEEQQWRKMESALADHEEGHVQIALDGAERILRAIHSSRCGSWRSAAATETKALNDSQAQYDRVTDHGRQKQAEYVGRASSADNLNGYPVDWTVDAAK